jgi:membrane protein DedA with SNARE-associated domain
VIGAAIGGAIRYGGRVVFFGRFVSVLRTYAAFLAGTVRMRWRRFFAFNASGGILWSVGYGLAAYYGQAAFKALGTPLDIALGIAAVGAIAWIGVLARRNAERLSSEAERALPDAGPEATDHQ